MRLNEWFVTNLDDTQRQIVMIDVNKNLIVQGPAGSGKTILAIHRAAQAEISGSFVIIVYTKALKRMIEFGLQASDLPVDSAVYEWSWTHRGIEVPGDVYCVINKSALHGVDPDTLYLKTLDGQINKYKSCSTAKRAQYEKLHSDILNNTTTIAPEERHKKEKQLSKFVTIDYADYVDNEIYYTFFRRTRWFELEEELENTFNLKDETKFKLVGSATL